MLSLITVNCFLIPLITRYYCFFTIVIRLCYKIYCNEYLLVFLVLLLSLLSLLYYYFFILISAVVTPTIILTHQNIIVSMSMWFRLQLLGAVFLRCVERMPHRGLFWVTLSLQFCTLLSLFKWWQCLYIVDLLPLHDYFRFNASQLYGAAMSQFFDRWPKPAKRERCYSQRRP